MTEPLLKLSELFYSLQGESTRAGLPCLFIRLADCNLRCSYCDSKYTWEEPAKKTSIEEIMHWVDRYPGCMVEITGGEPLLQDNTFILIDRLLHAGRPVLIETNGSVSIERIPTEAIIILDLKCPDSGMEKFNNWENIHRLARRAEKGCRDEIKFVLSSVEDFYWAKDIIHKYNLDMIAEILFSPIEKTFKPRELAELILQFNLPVRLQVQLHRILWPDQDRGV